MADALVSVRGVSSHRLITPGKTAISSTIKEAIQARLARTLYIISPTISIAFSVDELKIAEYLEQVYPIASELSQQDRPTRALGQLADDIGGIHALGVDVRSNNDVRHYCPVKNNFRLSKLGLCASVGSGAGFMKHQTEQWNRQIETSFTEEQLDPFEMVRGMAGAFNSTFLSDERYLSNYKSFGGFLEYVYFDYIDRRWVYGPPSAFITLIGSVNTDGSFSLDIAPDIYLYSANDYYGRILHIAISDQGVSMTNWYIEHLLDRPIYENVRRAWSGWLPLSCTFCVLLPQKNHTKRMHRSTNYSELRYIEISIGMRHFSFYIDPVLIDRMGEIAAQGFGMPYHPYE